MKVIRRRKKEKNVIPLNQNDSRRPSDFAKEGVCMQIKLVYAVSWQSTLVVESDAKKWHSNGPNYILL